MKPASYLSTVLPLLCVTALAQEPPPPASQLQKFEPMVGTWELSGTASETPGAAAQPWTGTQTVRRVLGGHFFRDEIILQTPGPQIAFVSFTGWDNENQRYVSYGASNMGMVMASELHIIGSNTFVGSMVNVIEGQPVTERSVLKMDGDTYTFTVEQAVGDGPFFTMVQGSGKKTSGEGTAQAVNAAMGMTAPAQELLVWGKMAGEYEIKGSMAAIPGSGMPDMAITGSETIGLGLGGTVVEQYVTGESPGGPDMYEAYGFIAWNARDKCYDAVSVDSMGMGGKQQIRKIDDTTLVGTMSAQMYGQPTVSRMMLKLDSEGNMSSVAVDSIAGTTDAQRAFTATYVKKR